MYSADTSSINTSTLSTLFSTTKSQFSSDDGRVLPSKICLVTEEPPSETSILVANSFELEVVTSPTGEEFLDDPSVLFVFQDFQGEVFDRLSHLKWRVLGMPALFECADQLMPLPRVKRPLLSLTMRDVVTCFTGIMDRQMAADLMFYVRSMGGSVRREPTRETTHLIACRTSGRKYSYAVTFIIPIMSPEWVRACWEHRFDIGVQATDEVLMVHRQKPFLDVFASFIGFPKHEYDEAADLLVRNGGVVVSSVDPRCTHIVADDLSPVCVPAGVPPTARVVRADWFWLCIQHVVREPEADFAVPPERFRRLPQRSSLKRPLSRTDSAPQAGLEEVPVEADHDELVFARVTPGSRLRRPSSISLDEAPVLQQGSDSDEASRPPTPSTPELFPHLLPPSAKCPLRGSSWPGPGPAGRRGSERSQASSSSQVSAEQAFATSARFGSFAELLQTEENYVGILDAILQMRSEALNNCQAGGVLLSQTEAKIIFGALMPISRTHRAILKDLRSIFNNWTEDANIGDVYMKYSPDLLRDYAPFVSSFEEARGMILQAAERSPRFHAFLKVCRGRPECGRQELHELMIRPVQRLGSCKLLLREILRHTPDTSADRKKLESALESLSEVLALINEDKRKMELLCQVFDVFNVVDNCPADLIASHRSLILHFEGIELCPHGFSKQGHQIGFFVFTDVMIVCKKKSKVVALSKGKPGYKKLSNRAMKTVNGKPYKFLQVLPLSSIRKIVEVNAVEGSPSVVGVIFRGKKEHRESCSYLRLVEGTLSLSQLVERWAGALAAHTCVADPEHFVLRQTMEEAGISQCEYLYKQKRKTTALIAVTQAFVNNAFSLGKTASSASQLQQLQPPACAMSSFNSTSRLETARAETLMSDDVFEEPQPQASSLTASIMRRM